MTAFADAADRVAEGADPTEEAGALVAEMTPEERRWCLDGDHPFWAGLSDMGQGGYHRRPFPAARVDRLGVPGFAFSDGPRGVVIGPATAFPVSMARGASWDLDLEERIGEAIGVELRSIGATLYGGVCVNILRHPAWGRAQETYGEDPHHVGEMGAALTWGVQRHAMACVKHFACNSMENARFSVDVTVDRTALDEVFLPHFKRIVDEGVASVMSAYNAVNGEWCGQSRELLTEILREEWGFAGFVISDWIFGLRDAGPSVHAGLDVEMPYRMIRAFGLDQDLAAGLCTEDEISVSVQRVLSTLLRFHQVLVQPRPGPEVLACDAHRALAREAAAKSVVLLRNQDELLPLDPEGQQLVAVLGPLADVRNLGDGGSSDVWAPSTVTVVEGMRDALGADRVLAGGTDPAPAAEADVALVVVGYTRADEGEFIGGSGTAHLTDLMPEVDEPEVVAAFEAMLEADLNDYRPPGAGEGADLGFSKGGDRVSLRLRAEDVELIRQVSALNPRTVVAVVAGSAVMMDEWVPQVGAVVQSWYAGMEGGHGLADVLTGRCEPGGRLPFTVPRDERHLPPFDRDADAVVYDQWHGYWRLARDGHEAAYPFGFGLSYTNLALVEASESSSADGLVQVSVTVENRGARPGVEVVQVYGRRNDQPSRLLGFARVEVAAGRRRQVEVEVPVATDLVAARHAGDPDGIAVSAGQ